MSKIGYQGQLCGPFIANDNIVTIIKNQIKETTSIENDFDIIITHLGIQANHGTVVRINSLAQGKPPQDGDFYISKRKILEFNHTNSDDCEISSIFFPEGADSTTIIDYTFK